MQHNQDFLQLKARIHQYCLQNIDDKLKLVRQDLSDLKEAQQQEIKSSMGDKYETGPAMLHQQRQRLLQQQAQLIAHQKALIQLNPQTQSLLVQPGALLSTDQGLIYIAIGLGSINYGGDQIWVISLHSPLGQHFDQLKAGDKAIFKGKEYLYQAGDLTQSAAAAYQALNFASCVSIPILR